MDYTHVPGMDGRTKRDLSGDFTMTVTEVVRDTSSCCP
jgi:hypothetical protein